VQRAGRVRVCNPWQIDRGGLPKTGTMFVYRKWSLEAAGIYPDVPICPDELIKPLGRADSKDVFAAANGLVGVLNYHYRAASRPNGVRPSHRTLGKQIATRSASLRLDPRYGQGGS
jgi:hypothetical protein